MKTIIKIGISFLSILVFLACSEELTDRNLGNLVNTNDVKISVTPDANDPNLIHFKLLTADCQALFVCPEAQINESGIGFSKKILWADTYTMDITAYNKAGYSQKTTITFVVNTTDPTVCTNEKFSLLTGGCNALNGKTWRLNSDIAGAIGCGDAGANNNNWWAPAVTELENLEILDDDITFYLNSRQEVHLDNHGKSYMNEACGAAFPDGDTSNGFVTSYYTPSPNAGWSISEDGNGTWLVLSGVVPCYGVDESMLRGTRYKIFSLTETELHIAYIKSGEISWHYYFTSLPR
jgi:hypothetical protein